MPITIEHYDEGQDTGLKHIGSCQNQYRGPVFIVASGPSAKNFSVKEFAHIPMITVNGAISSFLQEEVNPLFYICTDSSFPRHHPELFRAAMYYSDNVVLHDKFFTVRPFTRGNLFLIAKSRTPGFIERVLNKTKNPSYALSLFSRRQSSIGFSKDLSQGWVDARTVTYVAVQLAYHLGFNQVFLVGFDLNTSKPRFYEQANSYQAPTELEYHYSRRILPCLQYMRREIICERFRVYNLSSVSKVPVDVIPKIALADLNSILKESTIAY